MGKIVAPEKGKGSLVILVTTLSCLAIILSTCTAFCSYADTETAGGNVFGAWTSDLWTQTSQADYESGVLTQADAGNSSGNVILALIVPGTYQAEGYASSSVLDSGAAGTTWDLLSWDETLETSTDISFEVRAADTPFECTDVSLAWQDVGGTSPVTSGLPSGRYLQWRAKLTASDTAVTPVLHEVRVWHYVY